jgi:hypothetical protein
MKPATFVALTLFVLSEVVFSHQPFSASANSPQQSERPNVKLDPSSIEFGNQVAKRPSKPQRITATNAGEKKLYVNSVVLAGDNRQDFTIVNDTCTGSTIDPAKSCVVDVTFTPSVTERRKASVVFTDNAFDSPQNVPLAGTGINSINVPPR